MDTIKKEVDEFKDTKKFINALTEDKLNQLDEDKLLELSIFLVDEMKNVFREIKRLSDDNKKLIFKHNELENSKKPINKYADYPKDKDYIAKLLFILSKNEVNMTFEDIVNVFFQLEHDLNEKWRNPNKSISKIISRAYQFKVVGRKKSYGDTGCYVYSLFRYEVSLTSF